MATANELFQDAMIRRQIYLAHFSESLTGEIIKLLDNTESDVRDQLERRLATIVDQGGVDFGPKTTARLKLLEASIHNIRQGAMDDAYDTWDQNLQGLAAAEPDFVYDHFNDVSPVSVDLLLPDPAKLGAIVASQPFHGKTMKDWADSLADSDTDRIMSAIRVGLTQGEGIDDIARRVLGSASQSGADGVLEMTRRNAQAITRTAINHVSNEARQAVFAANSDIFDTEAFVAVLDSRTTEICAALDGKQFPVGEGPQPPLHWNCRSTRVAVIDAKGLIGYRPENSTLSDDDIEAKVGYVPATTTYQDFLERQTDDFQDHVLGPTRGALFRDGDLALDKFVIMRGRNLGDLYTLDELRKREPAAFRRAGI